MTDPFFRLPTFDEQARRILKLRRLLEECRLANAQLRAANESLQARLERLRTKRKEAAE